MESIKSIRHVRLWQIYQNSYLSYFLMYNFYYLSWALFSALISVYLMNMGFRASDVSLVVSASFLTSLITQPIIGKWNDQYDMKVVNTILFVIAIIGAILFQVIAGYLIDFYSCDIFYLILVLLSIAGMVICLFYRIPSGRDQRLFDQEDVYEISR